MAVGMHHDRDKLVKEFRKMQEGDAHLRLDSQPDEALAHIVQEWASAPNWKKFLMEITSNGQRVIDASVAQELLGTREKKE